MKKAGCGSWLLCIFAFGVLISACADNPTLLGFACTIPFVIFCGVWAGRKIKSGAKQDTRGSTMPAVPVDQLTGKEY